MYGLSPGTNHLFKQSSFSKTSAFCIGDRLNNKILCANKYKSYLLMPIFVFYLNYMTLGNVVKMLRSVTSVAISGTAVQDFYV